MMKEYTVCALCLAYNEEAYIGETLKGFVTQKTNFPFIAVVIDDACTDQTAEFIRQYEKEYPDIIKGIYLDENHYSIRKPKFPYYEKYRNHSTYFTICEGDDFWNDPNKLQKQVDFLESHLDYNLCCHDWNVKSGGIITDSPIHHKYTEPFSFTFATLPYVWITKTLTVLFRESAIENIPSYKYTRDVHLVYHALKDSKGYFMNEVMGTYTIREEGVWSKVNLNKRNELTYNLYKELYFYEPNKAVRKRYMNATLAYFNGLVFSKDNWYRFGRNAKLYFEAIRNISDAKDLIFCLGALVPTSWVKWVMKKFKI
ncbi:MAG: glycosyltransferase [Bacteroidales bacterium]|nr:glycosyltransferase [Bacteroidales bacterium]